MHRIEQSDIYAYDTSPVDATMGVSCGYHYGCLLWMSLGVSPVDAITGRPYGGVGFL